MHSSIPSRFGECFRIVILYGISAMDAIDDNYGVEAAVPEVLADDLSSQPTVDDGVVDCLPPVPQISTIKGADEMSKIYPMPNASPKVDLPSENVDIYHQSSLSKAEPIVNELRGKAHLMVLHDIIRLFIYYGFWMK
jgi:hypothetical protein